jgi:hypothetical protein
MMTDDEPLTQEQTRRRATEALRRALNTPPKQHKDMKKGKRKKRQDDQPTASGEKRD